jgi:hypothetical protein
VPRHLKEIAIDDSGHALLHHGFRFVAGFNKLGNQFLRGGSRRTLNSIRLGRAAGSRARITQIMNLLNLAPDIEESLLFGHELAHERPIRETHLRRLTAIVDWTEQRRLWQRATR